MKGIMMKLLVGVLGGVTALNAPPEGYEYKMIGFGEAEPQRLQPKTSLAGGDQFGRVVAMWNGIAAVASNEMAVDSSTGEVGTKGKVFFFHRDYLLQWVDSEQYFTSGVINDGYGTSVALYDRLLAVGAPTESSTGTNRGKVYLYVGSYFDKTTSLEVMEHAEDNDYFGSSVAITHGFTTYYGTGTVVVGAYGHSRDKEHEATGCVFVFAQQELGFWLQVGIVEPSFPISHGGFGYSVASYKNSLVVGSYGSDHVHMFELHGFIHECPHEDPEHQMDDLPEACQEYVRESNTEVDNGSSNKESQTQDREKLLDIEKASRLSLRSRALQGPPEEEKKYYTEWRYEEELMIGFNVQEEHKPEDKSTIQHFGSSVAVYNESGLITIAVGCSECVTDNRVQVGAVYIFSKLAQSDAATGWYPDDYHPREEEPTRLLQDGKEEERKFLWDPFAHETHASKSGDFWFIENSFWGNTQYEHFGWSICIDDRNLLVGNNPTMKAKGRAEVFSRTYSSYNSKEYIVSGPFSRSKWVWGSSLLDKSRIAGDKYGFSVALYKNDAIVGSILSGLQSDGTFGTGAAYVYQRVYLMKKGTDVVDSGDNSKDSILKEVSDTGTFLGISFVMATTVIVFCATLAILFGLYRLGGGEKTPRRLLLDTFGINDDGLSRSSRPLRLNSAMDDSASSVGSLQSHQGTKPRQSNMASYTGLNTSSSHGRPAPYKSRQQYVPKGPPKTTNYSPASRKSRAFDDL